MEAIIQLLRRLFPWLFPPEYSLSIACDRDSGYVGDPFLIYGYLKKDSSPIAGASITLVKDAERIATLITQRDGSWTYRWIADEEGGHWFQARTVIGETILESRPLEVRV